MKLSRLYSNQKTFQPLIFKEGLNLIIGGKILDSSNTSDYCQHNVGKSLTVEIIDFCLLGTPRPNSSLYKIQEEIKDYYFFLELKLDNDEYLTLARSTNCPDIVYYRITTNQEFFQDLSSFYSLTKGDMDTYLTSYTNKDESQEFNFRKTTKHFFRTTEKYIDPFNKDDSYSHADITWIPDTLNSWGFGYRDAHQYIELFDKQDQTKKSIKTAKKFFNLEQITNKQLNSKIAILKQKIEKKRDEIEQLKKEEQQFNFFHINDIMTQNLVKCLEKDISKLNEQKYFLVKRIESFNRAQQLHINEDFEEKIKTIFQEVGLCFTNQLVSSYENLIRFNKKITEERNAIIIEQLNKYRKELFEVNQKLKELEKQKQDLLGQILSEKPKEKIREFQALLQEKTQEYTHLLTELKKLNTLNDLFKGENQIRKQVKNFADRLSDLIRAPHGIISTTNTSLVEKSIQVLNQEIALNISFYKNHKPKISITNTKEEKDKAGETVSTITSIIYDISLLNSYKTISGVDLPQYLIHDSPFANAGQYLPKLLSVIFQTFKESKDQYLCTVFAHQLLSESDIKEQFLQLSAQKKINIVANFYIYKDDYSHTLFGKKI